MIERTVSRARLALAVVAVVVAGNDWRVDVNGVRDRFAEAVSGENHLGEFGRTVGYIVSAIDKYCEAIRIVMGMNKAITDEIPYLRKKAGRPSAYIVYHRHTWFLVKVDTDRPGSSNPGCCTSSTMDLPLSA